MTSAPARAWTSAWRTSASTVSSLRIRTSPVALSLMRPSWPWLVYGSSATSVTRPSWGNSRLMARQAWQTRLPSLNASLPRSSLRCGSVYGKNAIAGISSATARPASRTASSTLSRSTPGIAATGTRRFSPSIRKSGQMRSLVVRTCSATSRRAHSDLRLRRGRCERSRRAEAAMRDGLFMGARAPSRLLYTQKGTGSASLWVPHQPLGKSGITFPYGLSGDHGVSSPKTVGTSSETVG